MASSSVVRLRSGGTVAVRTGVLRGAGPQGPSGPPGPKGDPGPQGPKGATGAVSPGNSSWSGAAVVTIPDGQWYPVSFETVTNDDGIAHHPDAYWFQFPKAGLYRWDVYLRIAWTNVASGARRVRLVDSAGNTVAMQVLEASHDGATYLLTGAPVRVVDPSVRYRVEVQVTGTTGYPCSVTAPRAVWFTPQGAGPQGPAGPTGPVGPAGPQGPKGEAGDASSGFASFDGLTGGSDSTANPGGAATSYGDQNIPVPAASQRPALPYFFRTLAAYLERRIVARFPTVAAMQARQNSQPGELRYVADPGVLYLREQNGADGVVARVVFSDQPAPSGAGNAVGTLWVQY